jgi:hypothetical protein
MPHASIAGKALNMRSKQTASIAISSNPTEQAVPVLTSRAKDFITTRLARREPPEQIAAALCAYLDIEIAPAQVIPFWRGELMPPTQTGHRQDDKESVQFPADAEKEPRFTVMAPDAPGQALFSIAPDPDPISDGASGEDGEDGETTQTGHRQDEEDSLQIPADTVDEPTARDNSLQALGDFVKARLGIAPNPAPDPEAATRTGHGQEKKSVVLTDEVKTFIVKGLARYETPTRVAASVQANFGIEIDRRQVFAYDPAGSRKPAKRWIDLHAATRAKFMQATAEVGIAQKLVRLRMLDRFANRADENNQMERAAAFLAQAAKECGGFYERYQRPKGVAATADASAS